MTKPSNDPAGEQAETLHATVAILSTDGFEQSELMEPLEELRALGATVHVVSPREGFIRGWDEGDWGDTVPVDRTIEQAQREIDTYDALVLPGGVINPDKLRVREDARAFVRSFFEADKPVAAICHGPQILIDCGVLEGRVVTSYPSIRHDLKNAGAVWVDREVVVDRGLVTSRWPEDLPAFIDKIIAEVRQRVHAGQRTA